MKGTTGMKWQIDTEWGVGTDQYCWVLYRRHRNTWRGVSFYRTPAELLGGLFQILSRIHGAESDIVAQVEAAARLTVDCTNRLFQQIDAQLGPVADLAPLQSVEGLKEVSR